MKNINENEFEKKLEKIKNSKIELKPKTNKGENKMKKIKNINWKQIIETVKTIIIVVLITLPIGVYIGVQYQKQENAKIVEVVRNLSQK